MSKGERERTQTGDVPGAREDGGTARAARTGAVNPFYALLVLVATTFTFTALLYVATDLTAMGRGTGVAHLIARHGTMLLFVQGALILVFSIAAMALDSWRWRGTRRIRKGSTR